MLLFHAIFSGAMSIALSCRSVNLSRISEICPRNAVLFPLSPSFLNTFTLRVLCSLHNPFDNQLKALEILHFKALYFA